MADGKESSMNLQQLATMAALVASLLTNGAQQFTGSAKEKVASNGVRGTLQVVEMLDNALGECIEDKLDLRAQLADCRLACN